MPRGVPALNILPLEKPSERLDFSGHSGPRQLYFLLGEDPSNMVSWENRRVM
jgi:hypothetical protein